MSRLCLKKAWRMAVAAAALLALIGCSSQGGDPLTKKAASNPPVQNGASAEAGQVPSSKEAAAQSVSGKTEPSGPAADSEAQKKVQHSISGQAKEASKGQAEQEAKAGKEPSPPTIGSEAAVQTQLDSTEAEQGFSTKAVPTASESTAEANPKSAVLIRIQGDQEKGTILAETSVEIQAGDTVIDVTRRIAKEKKIQMETRGKGPATYVQGIANLYEFDKGGKSGWLFRVNGTFPNSSAGAVTVRSGDQVEWVYTLDLGKDVGKDQDAGSGGK